MHGTCQRKVFMGIGLWFFVCMDLEGVVDSFDGGEDECMVCGFEGVGGTAYDTGGLDAWWIVGRAVRL